MNRNTIVYSQWTFTDDDIHSGNMYLAMALMSDALEANTFTATVECADRSIINFERNTPLTYSYKGQQRGIFYVQSITRDGPTTYTISATSAIGLLIESLHYGGIYTGQTVAEVLPSICGTVPYVVKTNLRDIALYGWLPVASSRDNLSQVLFAIGASIRTDLDGVLHIETLWDGIVGNIGKDRLYSGAQVNYDAKVTQVVVTEHQYMEGGDEESLFEGTAAEGDIITFDDPMYGLTPSGLTILESGANYAKVSAGTGTLTGRKYIHNTREVARAVSQANEPNVITVTDATLVSLVNSVAVAERLVNYYQWTETIESGVVYDGELPGNRSNAWHPYDEEVVSGCLESADVNLSNTLKAEERLLVGYVPPPPAIGYIDQRVVLTGSGSWPIPAGMTQVRYVLIGGAQGGKAGKKGGDGDDRSFTYSHTSLSVTYSYRGYGPGPGGDGGLGGDPGHGGRVYQGVLDVTGLTALTYSCGVGGTGANYDANNPDAEGAEGTPTTLNGISSEAGTYSDVGYLDIITGETYATLGQQGIAGGRGGGYSGNEQIDNSNLGIWTAGESIVDEDGVTWNPGETNYFEDDPTRLDGKEGSASFNGNLRDGTAGAGWCYAMGSGPAAGENGITTSGASYNVYRNDDHTVITAWARQAPGSKGADATKVPAKANNGKGGRGGYGGGGGSSSSYAWYYTGSHDPPVGSYNTNLYSASSGVGGAGSKGGDGGDGLIILYYEIPEDIQSGPIKDKNGKVLLDKLGRLMVV